MENGYMCAHRFILRRFSQNKSWFVCVAQILVSAGCLTNSDWATNMWMEPIQPPFIVTIDDDDENDEDDDDKEEMTMLTVTIVMIMMCVRMKFASAFIKISSNDDI